MKVIKSKVTLERRLNFQKQKYATNAELKKKNHQSKLSTQNMSSVAKEEKLKTNQDRVKHFKKQISEGPYFICTICHRCFYSRSVRLLSMVNYKEFKIDYVAKATYDGKVYVCMTCHKSIMKKRTPCQAGSNTLDVEVAPKQLQNLRKLEKALISKRILFKKVAIMRRKGEFSKIKGNICNITVQTETVGNVLPRPINNNGLVLVKLKRHLRYRGYVCFEPVRPSAIYEALNYLKRKNKFYKDISIYYGLNSQEILNLSDISAIDETEADSLIVENESFESVDDPLNAHRAAGYETTLVPEIPRIIEDDNVIMAPGQIKTPVSVLNDDHCDELAFPYLFPTGKFGYKVKREIPLSPVKYFNQRLLPQMQIKFFFKINC